MDLVTQQATIEFEDGRCVRLPMDQPFGDRRLPITRFSFDRRTRELTLRLDGDVDATVEFPTADGDHAPRRGRPVVYVDQLHWIALAQELWAPDKLPAAVRPAAREIIALARNRQIILPLSSAHLVETTPTTGRRRRDLAATMLPLSRGWHMRNPARVRHDEIKAALTNRPSPEPEVISLRPHEVFAEDLEFKFAPIGAPSDLANLFPRLVAVSAIYSSLMTDERLVSEEGRTKAGSWANSHHGLAEFLRGDNADRERTRIAARARVLADLRHEVAFAAATAGIEPAAFEAWLADAATANWAAMPYLARLEGLVFHRLRNADDHWEVNDLHDIHFLTCAAGYADVVVGEKKTTEYLRRGSRRLGERAHVCATLPQAVKALQAIGVSA